MSPDKTLRTIFSEALDRAEGSERARYLARACGGDTVLRERVEKLLGAHDRVTGILPNG